MNNIINNYYGMNFGAKIRFNHTASKQSSQKQDYTQLCSGISRSAVKYTKKAFIFAISISALITKVKHIKNSVRVPS